MDVAIIGLPQSGKTTAFNALTRGHADTSGAGGEMHVGVVKVADLRLDVLTEMYHPKKTIQAEVKYWDLPGPESLSRFQGIGGKYRNVLQAADAYLLVVRAFTNAAVVHLLESVDPGRDLANMLGELAFADLEVLERAVARLEEGLKKSKISERPVLTSQLETIKKVKASLEDGVPLRRQHLAGSEMAFVANYQLLTAKPVIIAFNTD
ncbi:MAG: 50S ribosome-binding GTPase, partial [Dehalococcoidia bacterium]|nr:50S ribosome-binding GTPase [Dehalococcoidia bacterium]